MSRVAFSALADGDLQEIWRYSASTWGDAQADLYTDDIGAACVDLATGRKAGRPYSGRAGYLRYPVGRHVIFFKERDGGIVVIRVLHQRMDVARNLEDEGE